MRKFAFLPSSTLHLALLASLLSLGACQKTTGTTDPLATKAAKQFVQDMQSILVRDLASATLGRLGGAISLKVTLDRQYRPVGCSTLPSKPVQAALLPAGLKPSPTLASTLERQCWKTIYPVVPTELYGDNDTIEIVAPITLVPASPALASDNPWVLQQTRQAFFWQQLVRLQAVDSIGQALIHYEGDAQGNVTGCLVDLAPLPQRADAFRMDGELQANLARQCMKLDLRYLPDGFLQAQDRVKGYSVVQYAPWKVGRQ